MSTDAHHHSILIVEDEPALLKAITNKFVSQGYSVVAAKNGLEGLQLAEECHPSVIILDLMMPEMDGMTMLGKLRSTNWGGQIPVIVLTNKDDVQSSVDAWSLNAELYLSKTEYSLGEVSQLVASVLDRKSVTDLA